MFPSWVSPLDREAFLSILRRDDPTLSAEEYKQKEAALDQRSSRVLQHPLFRAGAAYGWAVRDEIQQLYDQLYPLGELEADQALEAIARHAGRIGSLAARAAAGLIDGLSGEPDEELRGVQSDANGAAKLLRLLLGESRHSWNLLAGDEHVVEREGQMLWHLYRINDLVKEHFPRAMEFVRPGFDDPAGRPCDPCISPLD
jgi:hypothetical protein